jgi:hypothetical protein
MKTLILVSLFLGLLLLATSCSKTPTTMLKENADTSAVVKFQGNFMGIGSETVSGQAKIYLQNGNTFWHLKTFQLPMALTSRFTFLKKRNHSISLN